MPSHSPPRGRRAKSTPKSKPTPKKRQRTPPSRSPEEVARRCIILLAVVASGHNDRRARLVPWLKAEGLWPEVSPRESVLLRKRTLILRDTAYATWRIESVVVLLWALRRLPVLPPLTMFKGSIRGRMPIPVESTASFIASARLRSRREILREEERIYRTHWAVRDAALNAKRLPKSIDGGVVQERHQALAWLTNQTGEPWDDVSTDT